jgi:hypothetical protein
VSIPVTTSEFAEEVWRRSNHLAWNLNYKGHARAVELARAAEVEGRPEEARLWQAVEARLRPHEPSV